MDRELKFYERRKILGKKKIFKISRNYTSSYMG